MIDDDNRDHVEEHDCEDHFDPYAEWIHETVTEITRRPWFVALESLPGDAGIWVGTEDELMAELRARAGSDVASSQDFPSGVAELVERPHQNVEYAFRRARLNVVDYRKEGEYRGIYEAPGWDRKAPMLVRKGVLAGLKPSHDFAIHDLLRYGNPLAIAVVLFTYVEAGRKFNKDREWSGRTSELAQWLSFQRVNLPDYPERSREVEEMLELMRPGDFRRFSGMMKTSAYILKKVGVKVSWEKMSGQNPISGENYTYTLWTIEAPNWCPYVS